jgi:glycosidase
MPFNTLLVARRLPVAWLAAAVALAACTAGTGPGPQAPAGLPAVNTSSLPFADPGSTLEAGWESGGVMQIFVRSYQDSDGDGVGDLRGLISRLDYLRDLGVKGLWLMPVTASQDGDHGYAVADYRAIEKAYGTLADFDELLKQAHARGLGVVIDYVINHSAASHPLFQQSRSSPGNPYRDWYVWQDPAPDGWSIYGGNPWRPSAHGAYFAPFSDTMPDFNFRLPAVVAFHEDNQRFWFNRGVDGLRFDAVGHLVENGPQAWNNQPENHPLMARMRALADAYRQRTIVCESPADARAFAAATSCGSAFAFGLSGSLVGAARGEPRAIQAVGDYFKTAPASMAPFLANHDAFAGRRVADQLQGDAAQLKLAAATLLLLPGRPYLYYGEEVGMTGAATLRGDTQLRTPMSWTADPARAGFTTGAPYRALAANVVTHNVAAQVADPQSILNVYKALLKLRNTLPSIARGRYEAAAVSGQALSWQRRLGDETTLVLINYGRQSADVDLQALPPGAMLLPLPAGAPSEGGAPLRVGSGGTLRVAVAPQSVQVWRVQR